MGKNKGDFMSSGFSSYFMPTSHIHVVEYPLIIMYPLKITTHKLEMHETYLNTTEINDIFGR